MIFTPEEIQQLFKIVDYRLARIVADVLGREFLTPQDEALLKQFGFDFREGLKQVPPYYQAFIFGRLAGILSPNQLFTLDYKDIREYVDKDQYPKLTRREKAEYAAAATRTYGYIKGMGERIKKTLGNSVSEEEIKNAVEERRIEELSVIKREHERGVLERRSVQAIVSSIGNQLKDWNRDWGRIVETEMENIFLLGVAQVIMEDHGPDALVYKDVFPGACSHCRRLYTTAGSGSEPRIFKLSSLIMNGDNIGRKARDWKPVIGATHPYCYSSDTEVLTKDGFKLFSELKGNEEFLSVNIETGEGEYVKAVKYLAIPYKGHMIERTSRDFNLCTTPNHNHVGISGYDKKLGKIASLRKEKDLPVNFNFLTHLPKWKGENIPSIQIDEVEYDMRLFCEFMGYYISEGSYTEYKGSHRRINISQTKESRDKIFKCCKKLFPSVSLQKERIEIYLKEEQEELIDLLKSLGHAKDKYIPSLIKELSPEYLKIFLDAFCLGDGTIHRGTILDGYQCKPQRIFSTSSVQLASDIGELLLKIGKRPSYRNKGKSIYHCKKQGKDYLAKYDQWEINECATKYNLRINLEEKLINYDGMVYDVELERNHTLIVRRGGKVCVSGNCRCLLRYLPKGYVWDEETRSFRPPKDHKPRVERKSKVYITVGNKKFTV